MTDTIVGRLADLRGVQRVLTGLATLDASTRGGLPLGKRLTIVGAPGAGKTGLAVQIAHTIADAGANVVILATDESASAIAIRIGQHVGLSREGLESGDPEALARLASELDHGRLRLEEGITIERAGAILGPSGARVLVVDSLQTATSSEAQTAAKKGKIEANVAALARLARSGILVIATSEMGREGYKGRASRGGLGSAKGSSDIEYDADLILALTTHDRGKTISVDVVKSRLGSKPSFTLIPRQATATFEESRAQEAIVMPKAELKAKTSLAKREKPAPLEVSEDLAVVVGLLLTLAALVASAWALQ